MLAHGTSASDPRRPSVLVVDDERGPRESLRMVLQPRNLVFLAASGDEALEILGRASIDVVTIDLNMPGMKGDELMRRIRQEHPGVEIIIVTGYGSVASATEGIRYAICDYIQKPFDVIEVVGAVARAAERQRHRRDLSAFLERLTSLLGGREEVRTLLAELDRSPRLEGRLARLLDLAAPGAGGVDRATVIALLEGLAESVELRAKALAGHARRVAFYAGILAERLGLPHELQEAIRVGALLHDLGKLGLRPEVASRAELPRTPEEAERLRSHGVRGSWLVEPLGLSGETLSAIRHHHERWDGHGPDGLRGEDVPLPARIVAVADAFDLEVHGRLADHARGTSEALTAFEARAGAELDPELTKELARAGSLEGDFHLGLLAESVGRGREATESAAPSAKRGEVGA
jgi:putative nucleotidyltransferase with HDIG domain